MDNFTDALDRLLTEWKSRGADIAEMAADLRCEADGLDAEQED